MSAAHTASLASLQARLGHEFRQPFLLQNAVTHSSYSTDNPGTENNQRLEFLGDAILQILIAEALYSAYPEAREGLLTKRRALLVNRDFLAGLAQEIGADTCMRFGKSEAQNGGREKPSALSDAFEAIVAALYLDSDFPTVRRIVLATYGDIAVRLSTIEDGANPKGKLQELIHPVHGNAALRYETTNTGGPAHACAYTSTVFLLDRKLGAGEGTSKKQAEEAAARVALIALRDSTPNP